MLNDIFLFLEYLYFLTLLQLGYSGLSDLLPNIIKQQNKQTNKPPPTHTHKSKKHPDLSKCMIINII